MKAIEINANVELAQLTPSLVYIAVANKGCYLLIDVQVCLTV
jgi:hypothetical protein